MNSFHLQVIGMWCSFSRHLQLGRKPCQKYWIVLQRITLIWTLSLRIASDKLKISL